MADSAALFLKLWLKHPLQIAAICPSGETIAATFGRMADLDRPGTVLELGAGTGSLTAGLLKAGCPLDRLVALECEPHLVTVLQRRFPGMHNSLDSLLKRYRIDASSRTKHGALIDTKLLALVYLELQGGKERGLELVDARAAAAAIAGRVAYGPRPRPLAPRATAAELSRHAAWVAANLKDKAVWFATGALATPGS